MLSTPRSPEPNSTAKEPPSTLIKKTADPIKHVSQQTAIGNNLNVDSLDKLQMQMKFVAESDISLQKIVDPKPF